MHHVSRRFPAMCVTTGVSAESAGVCKAPSVICGLGFHGLDFKRCLAGLTSASFRAQAPKKCEVRGFLSRQPQPPGQPLVEWRSLLGTNLWFSLTSWRKIPEVSENGSDSFLPLVCHVMGTLGRSWSGWGPQSVWGKHFTHSRGPGQE